MSTSLNLLPTMSDTNNPWQRAGVMPEITQQFMISDCCGAQAFYKDVTEPSGYIQTDIICFQCLQKCNEYMRARIVDVPEA